MQEEDVPSCLVFVVEDKEEIASRNILPNNISLKMCIVLVMACLLHPVAVGVVVCFC